jgi:hypothetical protein
MIKSDKFGDLNMYILKVFEIDNFAHMWDKSLATYRIIWNFVNVILFRRH